ncbi:MAG: DUF5317 domain-containing protein [Ilumatobacteraceae bacterium]
MVLVGVLAGLVKPHRSRFGGPRAVPVVLAAAAAQFAAPLFTGVPRTGLLVASVLLGALWIARQRRHLASGLLAIGACLNVAVIAANGGMPVDSGALARVGRRGTDVTDGFFAKHVAMTGGTRLSWLGDRIPVPIQRNVISVGDVLMAVAICLWIADSVGSWRSRALAGAVDGEHRGGPTREVVGDGD